LNTSQDSGNIVGWAPSILQDIQTKFTGGVDIGVKHLTNEFHRRRLIRILLLEMHDETESAILEWGINRADYNGVPMSMLSM